MRRAEGLLVHASSLSPRRTGVQAPALMIGVEQRGSWAFTSKGGRAGAPTRFA